MAVTSRQDMECERRSDQELLEKFQAGDRDAFSALYIVHHAAVFRFAFYMTGDTTKAADIVQDVFVWLIHHPRSFDPNRGELGAFLGGVARKMLQRQRRRERRWLPWGLSVDQEIGAHAVTNVAGELVRALDTEGLRKAIVLLPTRYREAVVLCDLEGRSYEEAARFVGCAVGTMRSRLHRARHLLARKFQPRAKVEKQL